jgi:hypothetical protein
MSDFSNASNTGQLPSCGCMCPRSTCTVSIIALIVQAKRNQQKTLFRMQKTVLMHVSSSCVH